MISVIKNLYAIIRAIPILPWINWNDKKFICDLHRWKLIYHVEKKDIIAFAYFMCWVKEFRNLFIYRNRYRRIFRIWIAILYKPMDTLFLQAKEIGGGLFIQHGFATMVSAESIGENCWINQQVTIGYSNKGHRAPIIGNNTMITCGAKILGPITVGDNVVVGANAVVIKDVQTGAVVGGVPAKQLK